MFLENARCEHRTWCGNSISIFPEKPQPSRPALEPATESVNEKVNQTEWTGRLMVDEAQPSISGIYFPREMREEQANHLDIVQIAAPALVDIQTRR